MPQPRCISHHAPEKARHAAIRAIACHTSLSARGFELGFDNYSYWCFQALQVATGA
jgi:hypothetical protein